MSVTLRIFRLALFCSEEELKVRRNGKAPGLQPWNHEVVTELAREVALLSSQQSAVPDSSELDHESTDWIGSQQVSSIIGWNIWTVQRRASDLDGRKVAGKYVFRESVVRDYADGLTDGELAG
ncbi:MAG: hypothetical protein QOI06_72 [Nocardioidaceae bacterium]|nr:hypothetical protein [Nocardioidaceae bacterium]